jgi:hypothetical protein
MDTPQEQEKGVAFPYSSLPAIASRTGHRSARQN